MTKTFRIALIVAVGLASALVLAQQFVGPVIRPGNTQEAFFPTPDSGYLTGGLIYGTTNRALYFSDGTQWLPLLHQGDAGSGGSGESYWTDGGSGRVDLKGVSIAGQSAGPLIVQNNNSTTSLTPTLVVSGRNYVGGAEGMTALSFMGPNVSSPNVTDSWANIFTSQSTNANIHNGLILHTSNGGANSSISFVTGNVSGWPGTGTGGNLMARIASANSSFSAGGAAGIGGSVLSYASAGNIAFAAIYDGARFDFGQGLNDYAVSDGTGIETPGYWESTRGVASGPGMITPSISLNALAATSLTTANSTSLGVGAATFSNVLNAVSVTTQFPFADGGLNLTDYAFTQLQVPTWEKQTMTTRILGAGKNTYAEIAERIPCSVYDGGVPDLVGMHTFTRSGFPATTTSTTTGRTYEILATIDGPNQAYKHPRCGTATGLYTTTFAGSGNSAVSYCQRIALGTTAATRTWVVMESSVPTTDTMANTGWGFRYSTLGGDTTWQACVAAGGSQVCGNTGVTPVDSEEYLLCTYRTTLQAPGGVIDAIYFFINGQYKTVYVNTTLLTPVSNVTPIVSLQGSGVVKAIGVGPMTVESR